jgi:Family of unknown function (DUF5343)
MPADFPYLTNPASLRKFLEKIRTVGVPEKVSIAYVASLGFKSTNDRPIIPTLKFLDFIDGSGVPRETWQKYRPKETAGAVLAAAIRTAYAELYSIYPDADRKDNEALRNYFSTHTKVGEATLNLIVRTFKTLCETADFSAEPVELDSREATKQAGGKGAVIVSTGKGNHSGPAININIQLQLQATEDPKVYDNFFAAMKKHLFPGE